MAQIFYYDEGAQAKFQQEKSWVNDTHFFKRVEISALGGTFEVMGLMQGKTDGDAVIVMDASAFLVEGTEARINAQADAYEYMVDYSQTNKQEESQLAKITRDSATITVKQVHGLMSQVIKDILFNSIRQSNRSRPESSGLKPMVET